MGSCLVTLPGHPSSDWLPWSSGLPCGLAWPTTCWRSERVSTPGFLVGKANLPANQLPALQHSELRTQLPPPNSSALSGASLHSLNWFSTTQRLSNASTSHTNSTPHTNSELPTPTQLNSTQLPFRPANAAFYRPKGRGRRGFFTRNQRPPLFHL